MGRGKLLNEIFFLKRCLQNLVSGGFPKPATFGWLPKHRNGWFSETHNVCIIDWLFCQEISRRFIRGYCSAFNAEPELAQNFKFFKSNGVNEFSIKHMEAGFNKEAGLGEFFFEFGEAVYEHKLIKALEKAGATQVTIMTFANNDANESASNALLRVWTVAAKSGVGYIRGACQEALLAKTKAKQQSAKEQAATSFDEEKTAAAIKQSLAELGEVNKQSFNKIGVVDGKVDTVDGKMDKVQEGVCVIIPEYKAETKSRSRPLPS